jgi:hypothetical protein
LELFDVVCEEVVDFVDRDVDAAIVCCSGQLELFDRALEG